MKIEIPDGLRTEIDAANSSLARALDASQFKAVVQVAQRAIGFYQKRVPELFADHAVEFYRERKQALEAGSLCDACSSIQGWRNHAHTMETEAATPQNVLWLQRIFDCALRGELHLRA